MVSCGNTGSDEKHNEANAEIADSIAAIIHDTTRTATPKKIEGTIIQQGELNDIFKSISSDNQNETGQKILVKQYQDSSKQDSINEPKSQKASKIEIQKALKKMAADTTTPSVPNRYNRPFQKQAP